MRLVCPNCGATYEVPDDVIPDGGRDVQCSNCSNTWFQLPAGAELEEDPNLSASVPEPSVDVPPEPAAPESFSDDGYEDDDFEDDAPVSAQATPPKPTMSPEAEDILRQEAEYAAQMRASDTADFETQPDLGLDIAETPREAQVRDRLSRLKGIEPEEIAAVGATAVAAADGQSGSRRDLLPDIEEINSTLNSADVVESETGSHEPQKAEDARRKGFRRGFVGVLLIFAILILLYLFAPQIKAAVPALGGVLDSYTALIDGLRLQLDGILSVVGGWANGLMEQATDAVNGAETPADPQ